MWRLTLLVLGSAGVMQACGEDARQVVVGWPERADIRTLIVDTGTRLSTLAEDGVLTFEPPAGPGARLQALAFACTPEALTLARGTYRPPDRPVVAPLTAFEAEPEAWAWQEHPESVGPLLSRFQLELASDRDCWSLSAEELPASTHTTQSTQELLAAVDRDRVIVLDPTVGAYLLTDGELRPLPNAPSMAVAVVSAEEIWLADRQRLVRGSVDELLEGAFVQTATLALGLGVQMDGGRRGDGSELFLTDARGQVLQAIDGVVREVVPAPPTPGVGNFDISWVEPGHFVAVLPTTSTDQEVLRWREGQAPVTEAVGATNALSFIEHIPGVGTFVGSRNAEIMRYEAESRRWEPVLQEPVPLTQPFSDVAMVDDHVFPVGEPGLYQALLHPTSVCPTSAIAVPKLKAIEPYRGGLLAQSGTPPATLYFIEVARAGCDE